MSERMMQGQQNAHLLSMTEQARVDTFTSPRRSDDFERLNALLEQLSPGTARRFTSESVRELARHRGTLCVQRSSEGKIVGMVVLTSTCDGTRTIGGIENLCVDRVSRGNHLGMLLMRHAITLSQESGHSELRLTSKPHRETANKLYIELGFKQVITNYYCLTHV